MKITGVRTVKQPCRSLLPAPGMTRTAYVIGQNVVGWSECYRSGRDDGRLRRKRRAILIGENPMRTEYLWVMIYARLREHG